jgi:hypothetical protein
VGCSASSVLTCADSADKPLFEKSVLLCALECQTPLSMVCLPETIRQRGVIGVMTGVRAGPGLAAEEVDLRLGEVQRAFPEAAIRWTSACGTALVALPVVLVEGAGASL